MSIEQFEIQLIAVLVAVACALPGVFLVLRRMAMMSDAISHSILPGIVVAFFLTHNLNSPLLIVAAAGTGVLTVILVELIHRTRLVREDAAIGIVFPFLFSVGVVLIARYAGDVHLDIDAVLLGAIEFATFDRLSVGSADLGPRALYTMGGVLVLNMLFLTVFYKELKLSTFDAGLAAALGFAPAVLHYVLMAVVSVTAVAAFDAVGSILVVALMVGPPAAAHLLTNRLSVMVILSAVTATVSAVSGFWLAHLLDASTAGSMATMVGVVFGSVYLFAPERGLLSRMRLRAEQRWVFARKMLTVHLLQHEGLLEEARESRVAHLQEHLRWDATFASRAVRYATASGMVKEVDGLLHLTDSGRKHARETVMYD